MSTSARIKRHIDKKDLVRIEISDKKGYVITHFNGFIHAQSKDLILVSDTLDFHYDGICVLRKKDISEIRSGERERMFQRILHGERVDALMFQRAKALGVKLTTIQAVLDRALGIGTPIILECKYGKDDRFIIGPVLKVGKKRVQVDHFGAMGEFELKPNQARFDEITFIRFDSPYANTFMKYAKRVG